MTGSVGAFSVGAVPVGGSSIDADIYSIAIPIEINVVYFLHFGISITVVDTETYLSIPIFFEVYKADTVAIPLEITVANPSGTIAIPLSIEVFTSVEIVIPITILVWPAFASGVGGQAVGEVVDLPANYTQHWELIVYLNGVDVSDRLTGKVSIDEDRNSAAIAVFSLAPDGGVVDLAQWARAGVEIYQVMLDSVEAEAYTELIFRGLVDTRTFDLATRVVEFTCTDNLQGVVRLMSRAEIDALTPEASYSEHVFDQNVDSWVYLMDRISTYPYAIMLTLNGKLEVYDWRAGLAVLEFDENSILDQSMSLSVANARDIINTIDVSLDARKEVYRETVASFTWEDQQFGSEMTFWHVCTPQMIFDAVNGAEAAFVSDPLVGIQPKSSWFHKGSSFWGHLNFGQDLTAISFKGAISKRFKQNTSEVSSMTVLSTESVNNIGTLRDTLSANISVEMDSNIDEAFFASNDRARWLCSAGNGMQTPREENAPSRRDPYLIVSNGVSAGFIRYPRYPVSYSCWDATGTLIEDIDSYKYMIVDGEIDTSAVDFSHSGAQYPGEYFYDFDEFILRGNLIEITQALNTLVAIGRTKILESHRQNRLSFSTFIVPSLKRGVTYRAVSPAIICTGIADQITRVFDIDTGQATYGVTLAISSSKAVGIVLPEVDAASLTIPIQIVVVPVVPGRSSSQPVVPGVIDYYPRLRTYYDGVSYAGYTFGGEAWGGFFTGATQDSDRVFAIEFPALPIEHTQDATIKTLLDDIEVAVPNDEIFIFT